MRIDPILHEPIASDPPTAVPGPSVTTLVAELAGAGLLVVEVDEDGDASLVLTQRGQRTARLMAMSKDRHALVLLGALIGSGPGLN